MNTKQEQNTTTGLAVRTKIKAGFVCDVDQKLKCNEEYDNRKAQGLSAAENEELLSLCKMTC